MAEDQQSTPRRTRVGDLAEELGVDMAALRPIMKSLGIFHKTPSTLLEPSQARAVRRELRRREVRKSSPRAQLATALKQLRAGEGLTLREAADRTGYSISSLNAAENGVSFPKWTLVESVVRELGGDAEEFRIIYAAAARENRVGRSGADHIASDQKIVPALTEQFRSVPSGVMQGLAEARISLSGSSSTVTFALTKWVIEAIAADKGYAGLPARRAIVKLYEEDCIDKGVRDWGVAIVSRTNQAVQPGSSTADRADVEDAVDFIWALATQIYLVHEKYTGYVERHPI